MCRINDILLLVSLLGISFLGVSLLGVCLLGVTLVVLFLLAVDRLGLQVDSCLNRNSDR